MTKCVEHVTGPGTFTSSTVVAEPHQGRRKKGEDFVRRRSKNARPMNGEGLGMMDAHVSWGEFKELAPELAAFGDGRLRLPPAYLATVRRNGAPRVHPVTPIIDVEALFVFMEPTSPKARDLR